jgi:hypothetical protein
MEGAVTADNRVPPPAHVRAGQPIASAPRDGTTILAWSDHAAAVHVVAYDPEPPAAWIAQSGEYILADEDLRFWAHLPGSRYPARATRVAAWLASGAAGILIGFLGMWVENAFDLLP